MSRWLAEGGLDAVLPAATRPPLSVGCRGRRALPGNRSSRSIGLPYGAAPWLCVGGPQLAGDPRPKSRGGGGPQRGCGPAPAWLRHRQPLSRCRGLENGSAGTAKAQRGEGEAALAAEEAEGNGWSGSRQKMEPGLLQRSGHGAGESGEARRWLEPSAQTGHGAAGGAEGTVIARG